MKTILKNLLSDFVSIDEKYDNSKFIYKTALEIEMLPKYLLKWYKSLLKLQ